MNLYFRLLRLIWKIWRHKKNSDPMAASRISFRVWPSDCDLNLHLNNARYLSFMDLGRLYHIGVIGAVGIVYKNRWQGIIHANALTFIKEFKPFTKVELESQIVGWDEKYFYFQQRFFQNGNLHAVGIVRVLFVKPGFGKIKTQDAIDQFAPGQGKSPELPEAILKWRAFLEAKKEFSNSDI